MLWGERKQGAMVVQADNHTAPPRGFNIGPLPLVWPFLRRLGVGEIVNAHCPADPQAEFPHGEVVEAMTACRLYNPVALYRVEEWAREGGAEHFLGIPADKLNDDRLGRTLEAIFPHRYSIMAHIALRAACEFDVPLGVLHYDPTHFLFYGEYDNQHEAIDLLNVRRGRHSRGSPSVKEAQVGVNVASDGLGSVPIFFHTGSGNEQHRTLAARNLEKLQDHLRPKRLLLIEDRGSFSREHGFRIDKDGFHFIAALPWSQELQRVAIGIPKDDFAESRFLSIAETRKRQAAKPASSWESYRLAERPRTWKHPDRKNPAQMAVRIVFVHSSADAKAAKKARRKYTETIRQGLLAIQASVAKGCRNTDPVCVARRVAKVMGRKSAAKYFRWDTVALEESERQALGKPGPGRRRPTHRFEFTYDPSAAEADAQWDGYWALATNLPTTDKDTDDVFCAYKDQSHIDVAHHQLKSPLRIHPVFLHKQERIEALVLVLFLALMVFYLLQREYRRRRSRQDRTTGETLIRAYTTVCILVDGGTVTPCARSRRQLEIASVLRLPTVAEQIAENRARSPTSL
jgi:transposase